MVLSQYFHTIPVREKKWYSSPPQLRYPQLSYFHSSAILNWVPKNSSKAIFPTVTLFFPPVTLENSVTGGKKEENSVTGGKK